MKKSKQFDEQEPWPSYGWIQWKGSDICADMECACGHSFHVHGEFLYIIRCPACKQVYECSGFFKLIPHDTSDWTEQELEEVKEFPDDA